MGRGGHVVPLLNSDVANLEWRSLLELSGDKVGIQEILDGLDTHTDNQNRFGLPSRLISKVFLFRWIYRGSAYAYANDADFSSIGDQSFWQNIIDAANKKYHGIYRYQEELIAHAKKYRFVRNHITGVEYTINPTETRYGIRWPEPDIVNYPNQGFGADIVQLMRVEISKRIENANKERDVLLILTVHDSLLFDCRTVDDCIWTAHELDDIARNFSDLWFSRYGRTLIVPHKFEHEVGDDYKNMISLAEITGNMV